MSDNVEAISYSFITGTSDVVEASLAAIKGSAADSPEANRRASIQEKFKMGCSTYFIINAFCLRG
ncbi:hypothetical protein SAY87_008020 [Trapa incisa]|uniref:DUF7798 domain-containing protein n=1 Tax=Trapa incisa TaxID=236973 RepID=A0AAN7KCJ4_9MYRT|nr:hypothetical protein SAY87_008020 [Trapa incisa]